jgi:hypothetical protein
LFIAALQVKRYGLGGNNLTKFQLAPRPAQKQAGQALGVTMRCPQVPNFVGAGEPINKGLTLKNLIAINKLWRKYTT